MDRVGVGEHERLRGALRQVLAADYACDPGDFLADGVRVVVFEERPGRRRYPVQAKRLGAITTGNGVIVSCDAGRVVFAQELLAGRTRDEIFSGTVIARLAEAVEPDGQVLGGPTLNYVCGSADLRPAEPPDGITLDVVTGDAVTGLYRVPGFPNALGYRIETATPDVLAVVARRAGEIVGMAGASADADTMWQIGVDVVPDARSRGVGRAVVSRLTQEVMQAGRIPFYATALSNIASRSIAIGLGYWPAWVEMNARDRR